MFDLLSFRVCVLWLLGRSRGLTGPFRLAYRALFMPARKDPMRALPVPFKRVYSRSPKVGNPIASTLKSNI